MSYLNNNMLVLISFHWTLSATLCPQSKTSDELDMMLGVNYVGHFLLTNLLSEKLLKHGTSSSPVRLINVVCGSLRSGHIVRMDELEGKFDGGYSMRSIYRSSKLALHLMTKELAHKHGDEGIVAYSVDPGLWESVRLVLFPIVV